MLDVVVSENRSLGDKPKVSASIITATGRRFDATKAFHTPIPTSRIRFSPRQDQIYSSYEPDEVARDSKRPRSFESHVDGEAI